MSASSASSGLAVAALCCLPHRKSINNPSSCLKLIVSNSCEIGAALCKQGRVNEAAPYLFKAISEDPHNMDAFIEIAFICPTKKDSMEFLDDGLKFGRQLMQKRLGARCFEDEHVGKFWSILDTRPYMRLLQTRVRFNFMMEDYKAAV